MRQTFSKDERLSSRRMIGRLFAEGSTFYLKPFRITWMRQPGTTPSPLQVMLSVPKYNFRKAVLRNLIRRRMREVYRLNKNILRDHPCIKEKQIILCITYTAKEIVPFETLREKIILLLHRLIVENEKVTG